MLRFPIATERLPEVRCLTPEEAVDTFGGGAYTANAANLDAHRVTMVLDRTIAGARTPKRPTAPQPSGWKSRATGDERQLKLFVSLPSDADNLHSTSVEQIMMSKWFALAASVVGISIANPEAEALEPYRPRYVQDAAWVCVERLENNGISNIVPVTISISHVSKITLLGGEAGCLILPAGDAEMSLSFAYPYGGPRASRYWTTSPQKIAAKAGSLVSYELCKAATQQVNAPQWAATGWHDMWLLRRIAAKSSRHCADEK